MFICWSQTDKALVCGIWSFLPEINCFTLKEKGYMCSCWAQLWDPGISRSKLCQEISLLASSCAPAVMKQEVLPRRQLRLNRLLLPRAQSSLDTEVYSGSIRWHQVGLFSKLCLGQPSDLFMRLSFLVILCRTYDAVWKGQKEYLFKKKSLDHLLSHLPSLLLLRQGTS